MDLITRFSRACGAATEVDLRIERTDGMPLAEGQLEFPFSLIGSDPDGEITLIDENVLARHACLQVIGGRVLIAALGADATVQGPAGGQGFAWLTTTAAVRIGPFDLHLRQPVSVSPMPLDRGFDPLQAAPAAVAMLPRTVIRFLNGRAATREWNVNRLMTFVGRSPDCKISLASNDVSDFHCYFVLTPDGLWVVDLMTPQGIRVNGEVVRFARLGPEDVLRVGGFEFAVVYPDQSQIVPAHHEPDIIPVPTVSQTSPPPPVETARPKIRVSGGTTIIRGQVVEQFRQSILEMMDSLSDLPRETVTEVHALLEKVNKLSEELLELETRTDPIDAAEGRDPLTKHISGLRNERKALWQRIFSILAAADAERLNDGGNNG